MLKRVVVGWALVYAALTFFPFPVSLLPGAWWLEGAYHRALLPLARAAGGMVGLRVEALPAGSGDTAFNYALVLLNIVAALVGAATLAMASRPATSTLASLLRVHLRYVLAAAMLSYGLAKVLVQQFPALDAERMTTTFGEASPMGLLWTCLGASPAYTIMGGVMECLGGALLLWRRTALVGALVLIPVMVNVVAMNFCYDVPVKVYSTHLLAAAVVIVLPDAGRLARMVLGLALPPADLAPAARGAARVVLGVAKVGVLGVIALALWQEAVAEGPGASGGAATADLPPDGAYEVVRFEVEGAAIEGAPKGATPAGEGGADAGRWRTVTFAKGGMVSVRSASGSRIRFTVAERVAEGERAVRLTLAPFGQPEGPRLAWRVRGREGGDFEVRTGGDGRSEIAVLGPLGMDGFYLPSRRFRWVIERPDNR